MRQFLVHANAPPHILAAQNENIRQLVNAYRHQGVLVVFQRRMGVTYNAFRQQHHLPANLTVQAFQEQAVQNPLPAGISARMRNAVNAYLDRGN
jgi:hypothetical protein